ncbi:MULTISPECIES: VOC family protein [Rhodococcus]|uniref:VOC family protein n=1 Tax=Rhodococcus erythropolis TaxID=1833 RepID=A0A8I1D5K4_RHOER|nr:MULTISPECIES: VOC family protein [Rhodococcus]MBH5144300.1 VOC family protein [Rhodococcus erythropolis]MBX9152167.1 glyoxalase/bleomycin resistance/dioxygenase family protein [Rhodococcus qingshengii]MDJ0434756.1 VOC family protein [Rhodococcus qingshengii]QEM25765.1 glyoxalase/bleomycin resistance/dioxygenase family protein [Rhodococcus qingshengii]
MNISLSFASMICRDVVTQADFYRDLFDLPETVELASEHFRALRIGDTSLGFNAPQAISLLDLPESTPLGGVTTTFWTFEVDTDDQVDALTKKAVSTGAVCIKEPYTTYYGSHQSVLLDLEGNAFRINNTN